MRLGFFASVCQPYQYAPSAIPGLLAWFDGSVASSFRTSLNAQAANNAIFTTWQDQSGNANHAVAPAGKEHTYKATGYGGLYGASYSSTAKYMSLTTPLANVQSVVVLMYDDRTIQAVANTDYVPLVGHATSFDYAGDVQSTRKMLDPVGSNAAVRGGTAWRDGVSVAPTSLARPYGSQTIISIATGATMHVGALISDRLAFNRELQGPIAEIALFSTDITPYIPGLMRYFARKRPKVRQLIGYGNSLISGQDASQTMTSKVSTLYGGTWELVELGIGGRTLAQMSPLTSLEVNQLASPYANRPVVVVSEVINDLLTTQNPTTTYNTLVSVCTTITNAGLPVIVCTPTPRVGEGTSAVYANYETHRQAVRTSILGQASPPWVAVADWGGDANLGAVPAITGNAYYAVDGVSPNRAVAHFTNAGQAIAAQLVVNAMQSVGL